MESFPALDLVNVTVELGGEAILRGINLTVHHGETLVVVGPSGGGKTVLLKTMAGIIAPTQGHVHCEGEDWQNLKTEAKRELARKIGVQFQKSALFDSLTVYDNVAFPLREHRPNMAKSEVEEAVQYCLTAVDLWGSRAQMPYELSGGMQLRLGVARAIVLHPKIIFYDDPTAGLDPINSDKMVDLILNLKGQYDSTVVVVTHDILRAFQLAGRIILVANQEIIEMGSADEAKNHKDPRVQQFIHGQLEGPLEWG